MISNPLLLNMAWILFFRPPRNGGRSVCAFVRVWWRSETGLCRCCGSLQQLLEPVHCLDRMQRYREAQFVMRGCRWLGNLLLLIWRPDLKPNVSGTSWTLSPVKSVAAQALWTLSMVLPKGPGGSAVISPRWLLFYSGIGSCFPLGFLSDG